MDKKLLPNPDPDSDRLYEVYKTCWEWNAEDRPSVLAVVASITAR